MTKSLEDAGRLLAQNSEEIKQLHTKIKELDEQLSIRQIFYAAHEKLLILLRDDLHMNVNDFWQELRLSNAGKIAKQPTGSLAQQVKAKRLMSSWQRVARGCGAPLSPHFWEDIKGARRFFDGVAYESGFRHLSKPELQVAAHKYFQGNRACHKPTFLKVLAINDLVSQKLQLDPYSDGQGYDEP